MSYVEPPLLDVVGNCVGDEITKLIHRGTLDDRDPEARFVLCALPIEALFSADGAADPKAAALHVFIWVRGLDADHAQRVAEKIKQHTGPDYLKDPFFHALKAGMTAGVLSHEDAVRADDDARKWNAS